MTKEEILEDKKEFCSFLHTFADGFEKTTDLYLIGAQISAFFMTLKTSIWQEIAQGLTPFIKGK